MEEYIVSFCEGRVRLRHPILHDPAVGAEISAFIQNLNGMEKVEHKALTGSLLITYDPEMLTEEDLGVLLEQGGEWLKENAPTHMAEHTTENSAPAQSASCGCNFTLLPKLSTADKRKILKRGLALSLLVTLGSLVIGGSGVHKAAGTAMALFAAEHIWQRRRAL